MRRKELTDTPFCRHLREACKPHHGSMAGSVGLDLRKCFLWQHNSAIVSLCICFGIHQGAAGILSHRNTLRLYPRACTNVAVGNAVGFLLDTFALASTEQPLTFQPTTTCMRLQAITCTNAVLSHALRLYFDALALCTSKEMLALQISTTTTIQTPPMCFSAVLMLVRTLP